MFNEKLLEIPYARLRKTIAILLYVLFMIWVIYTHNKSTGQRQLPEKKPVASSYTLNE